MCHSEWSVTRLLSVSLEWPGSCESPRAQSPAHRPLSHVTLLFLGCREREKSSPLRLISWRPACEGLLLGSLHLHLLPLRVPCFSRQGLLIPIGCLRPLAQKGKGDRVPTLLHPLVTLCKSISCLVIPRGQICKVR